VHPYLQSVILGIVEGLTEFLPVSSTAHLRIIQSWMSISEEDPFWKAYAIIIQLGAVLCLPFYFWGDIKRFIRSFPRGENKDRNFLNHPLTLVAIAFHCTAIPALILKKEGVISENLEDFQVMGWSLVIGGVVMWVVDVIFRQPTTERMDRMTVLQAVWIGLIQTLSAVFPGVSRSMATIAAGQSGGLTRKTALEFSFFVSIPIMFAATGKELSEVILKKGDFAGGLTLRPDQWITLAIGFVVSFIVALAVVHLVGPEARFCALCGLSHPLRGLRVVELPESHVNAPPVGFVVDASPATIYSFIGHVTRPTGNRG
jgi:undecaprenyl-diphosphatase